LDLLDEKGPNELPVQLWSEASTDPEIRAIVSRVFRRLNDTSVRVLAAWKRDHPDGSDRDPEAWAGERVPALLSLAEGYLLQRVVYDGFDREGYRASVRALLES
ncbi:MAG: TetR family transcriptional regulator C-terminal domain-containing protein, partial [Leucobacter sp.]